MRVAGGKIIARGYTGKILVADLISAKASDEQLHDRLHREFIGGVGLGIRLLYEYQPNSIDVLIQSLTSCVLKPKIRKVYRGARNEASF